jgi:hypothetical protein
MLGVVRKYHMGHDILDISSHRQTTDIQRRQCSECSMWLYTCTFWRERVPERDFRSP